jgi:prolyl-tRNA synthetase
MRYSKTIAKTLREAPKDADTLNHRLLTQAGYVDQLMAGVYSYLPLGLNVLRKIENIVRNEMNEIGGQEVLMAMLHPKSIWEQTGAWDNVDVLFKINSRTEKEYALGQSEEEVATPLVMSRLRSYKDLPTNLYQIHWKFRDELRAKSGIMRGREFLMKDMYSFHQTQEDFQIFYETVKNAYLRIFAKLGLDAKVTEASGGAFSTKISYEFMVLTDAGEDDILYCDKCNFCVNQEIAKVAAGDDCQCSNSQLKMAKASEVGNVFDLGQKYGKDFDLGFIDKDGNKQFPVMGCYGLGISRVMGVIVEKFADSKGLVWPTSIAPFNLHLVGLDLEDSSVKEIVESTYTKLQDKGITVLFDDRQDVTAGEKFKDADLIGIPYRAVVSKRTGDLIEIKSRTGQETENISFDELVKRLQTVH